MTFREKIARAMFGAEWSGLCDTGQGVWLSKADAVLDAMLEPSEGMMEEGWFTISAHHPCQSDMPRGVEAEAWQAMLRAAKTA